MHPHWLEKAQPISNGLRLIERGLDVLAAQEVVEMEAEAELEVEEPVGCWLAL